ncbi:MULTISPECIES: integrating conjugative element protein [unclassified Serratia (in: enterobacteria)]|uniref:integrating conjugative element protein n=1 Tax=unclassified Serratia (in: enterobacteria) TaxID=2647522 RepID=UPI00307681BA
MKQALFCRHLIGGLALLLSTTLHAEPRPPTLTVVADLGGSDATPYYAALEVDEVSAPGLTPSRTTPYSEADMMPVRSPSLTPGIVEGREIQAPGLAPLFLLGDDPRSIAWLKAQRPRLASLEAVGLVVQVDNPATLARLRQLAPELSLLPVSGDDLAQRLGLRHYPVLVTATRVEQ